MQAIINDYEDFCITTKLIRKNDYRMLTVACGYTLKDNFKNSVYYDPASRGYSYFSHLGIYDNKCVRGIGKIENIVTANLKNNNTLEILKTTVGNVTSEQRNNIINIIEDAKNNIGWDVSRNNKFFCVREFIPTDFRKVSKRGLFGKRYFNLNNLLERKKFKDTKEIAELLKSKTW